jgi:hypothetical protein
MEALPRLAVRDHDPMIGSFALTTAQLMTLPDARLAAPGEAR